MAKKSKLVYDKVSKDDKVVKVTETKNEKKTIKRIGIINSQKTKVTNIIESDFPLWKKFGWSLR